MEAEKNASILFFVTKKLYIRTMGRKLDIYQIDNPLWFSDTFVFARKEIGGKCFDCYIKLNGSGKIEEIGSHFEKRFRYTDFESVRNHKFAKIATDSQRRKFNSIGDEYWLSKIEI